MQFHPHSFHTNTLKLQILTANVAQNITRAHMQLRNIRLSIRWVNYVYLHTF